MARRMASSTVKPGLAERASPVRITVPAVVWDKGRPRGSVVRSNGFEVAQPRTRVEEASRRKKARVRSMVTPCARVLESLHLEPPGAIPRQARLHVFHRREDHTTVLRAGRFLPCL